MLLFQLLYNAKIITVKNLKQQLLRDPVYFRITFLYLAVRIFQTFYQRFIDELTII